MVLVVAISWSCFATVSDALRENLTQPEGPALILSLGDAKHYYEMAKAITEGRFAEIYPSRWAHRQPLYPLTLALTMRMGDDDLYRLGMVNAIVGIATIWLVYLCIWTTLWNQAVALLGALALSVNEFIVVSASRTLYTEPLYVACALATICFGSRYVTTGRLRNLCLASGTAGLAYLTRPNGLFLMAGMVVVLLGNDLMLGRKQRRRGVTRHIAFSYGPPSPSLLA